jgi:cellulose biosynthesis protein BcsQ
LSPFPLRRGGAGKTTLTVLMASYLHYVKGMDVAVIDCDYPQYSIRDIRERDMKNIERNPSLKKNAFEQFSRLKKRMYPIVESRPENAVEKARDFISMGNAP